MGALRDGRGDERGSITPLLLMFIVAVTAGGMVFTQFGHASMLATEAGTAADAAAIAGAKELHGQLVGRDLSFRVDRDAVCAAARDYAARNGATLASCEVDTADLTVTVAVRGDRDTIDGPLDVEGQRPVRTARAQVDLPIVPGLSGVGGWGGSPALHRGALHPDLRGADPEELLGVLIGEAQRIHELRLPYVWGGGHQSSPAPPNGPFDCSGAVSRILQTIYPDFPTSVSGQFASVGAPGPSPSGKGVTIYAYSGHVFMTIGGRGWGTGENGSSDGAGWLPYNAPYHSLFTARHVPLLEPHDPGAVDDLMRDLAPGGSQAGGAAVRAEASIRLVPVDG